MEYPAAVKNKKAILQQVLRQDFQDIRQDAKFYSFYDLNVFKWYARFLYVHICMWTNKKRSGRKQCKLITSGKTGQSQGSEGQQDKMVL